MGGRDEGKVSSLNRKSLKFVERLSLTKKGKLANKG